MIPTSDDPDMVRLTKSGRMFLYVPRNERCFDFIKCISHERPTKYCFSNEYELQEMANSGPPKFEEHVERPEGGFIFNTLYLVKPSCRNHYAVSESNVRNCECKEWFAQIIERNEVPVGSKCLLNRHVCFELEKDIVARLSFSCKCFACYGSRTKPGQGSVDLFRKEKDKFLKKLQCLERNEFESALVATRDQIRDAIKKEITCKTCRLTCDEFFDVHSGFDSKSLDPLMLKADGSVEFANKDHLKYPEKLASLYTEHLSFFMENLCNPSNKSYFKSSGRCVIHVNDFSMGPVDWMRFWFSSHPFTLMQEILSIPFSLLRLTIDRYLKKHSFCSDCSAQVNQAYSLLVQGSDKTLNEVDESKQDAKEATVQEARSLFECDKSADKFLNELGRDLTARHIVKKTCSKVFDDSKKLFAELKVNKATQRLLVPADISTVRDLIIMGAPEIDGLKQERHAKTLEAAQKEILVCLGYLIFTRLQRAAKKAWEACRASNYIFTLALKVQLQNFYTAVEKKQGISELDQLVMELELEEKQKAIKEEKKKARKKQKRHAYKENLEAKKALEVKLREEAEDQKKGKELAGKHIKKTKNQKKKANKNKQERNNLSKRDSDEHSITVSGYSSDYSPERSEGLDSFCGKNNHDANFVSNLKDQGDITFDEAFCDSCCDNIHEDNCQCSNMDFTTGGSTSPEIMFSDFPSNGNQNRALFQLEDSVSLLKVNKHFEMEEKLLSYCGLCSEEDGIPECEVNRFRVKYKNVNQMIQGSRQKLKNRFHMYCCEHQKQP